MSAIIKALRQGDRVLALTLIQHASPKEASQYDDQGQTPLHIAVQKNYLDIVKALIDRGANINALASDPSYSHMTPLHYAALTNNLKAAELLLHEGANIHLENGDFRTAATLAHQHGFAQIARMIERCKYEFVSYPGQLPPLKRPFRPAAEIPYKNPVIEGFYRKILELQNSSVEALETRKWMAQKLSGQKQENQSNVVDFMEYRKNKMLKKQ